MARILQAYEGPHGGIANHVRVLAMGLASRGHEVTVAGPLESQAYPDLERAGIRTERLPFTGSITAVREDSRTARALARIIRAGGFDVAHAHGMKAGVVLRSVAAARTIPVLYTPHGFPFIFSEHRDDLRHPRLRRAMAITAERTLGMFTARLICVSEAERGFADKHHIARADHRRVVPNGVAVDRAITPDPALLAWRGDGPLFAALSVLRWEKGLHHLIDAAALLGDAPPGLKLAIAGDGPEREALSERIERAGVGDRIRLFAGFAPRVEERLAAIDGFVLPSDRWEAGPIALIEAMAFELPAIGSRLGGVPELIEDGRSGLLVPAGDPAALAAAIRRLADDRGRASAMGERGRKLAESRFSLDGMIEAVEELYLEVAPARRARIGSP
jgi:glycosyltransferase involved in cell wall biosynthesis